MTDGQRRGFLRRAAESEESRSLVDRRTNELKPTAARYAERDWKLLPVNIRDLLDRRRLLEELASGEKKEAAGSPTPPPPPERGQEARAAEIEREVLAQAGEILGDSARWWTVMSTRERESYLRRAAELEPRLGLTNKRTGALTPKAKRMADYPSIGTLPNAVRGALDRRRLREELDRRLYREGLERASDDAYRAAGETEAAGRSPVPPPPVPQVEAAQPTPQPEGGQDGSFWTSELTPEGRRQLVATNPRWQGKSGQITPAGRRVAATAWQNLGEENQRRLAEMWAQKEAAAPEEEMAPPPSVTIGSAEPSAQPEVGQGGAGNLLERFRARLPKPVGGVPYELNPDGIAVSLTHGDRWLGETDGVNPEQLGRLIAVAQQDAADRLADELTGAAERPTSDVAAPAVPESEDGGSERTDAIRPDGGRSLEGAPAADVRAPEGQGAAPPSAPERAGDGQEPDRGTGAQPGGGRRQRSRDGAERVRPAAERDGGALPEPRQDAVRAAGVNYHITEKDRLGQGSVTEKFNDNIKAIELLKRIEEEGRSATPEEQATLARYVGWGGMPQAFGYYFKPGDPWEPRAKRVKELLTDEEYQAARASTTNAHFTAPEVVSAIWDGVRRLGFKGGRVLEPAVGSGNFFGLMPRDLMGASKLTGIELDSLTARIAKQLYQGASVVNKGYQDAKYPDGFFDLVISNVPFSEADHPVDKRHNKARLNLHDYYFAKSLDLVRPGGIVAFITSKGTLDKQDTKARKIFAEKADLIAAFRLPETAFEENALTTVTTDVIFMRRKAEGAPAVPAHEWVETIESDVDISGAVYGAPKRMAKINAYFAAQPDHVLGEAYARRGRYGYDQGYAVKADGRDLGQAFRNALTVMPENVVATVTPATPELEQAAIEIPEAGATKDGGYAERDGKLFQRSGQMFEPVAEKTPAEKKRGQIIRASLKLRDTVRELLRARANDAPEAQVKAAKEAIDREYKAFVKKHGLLNIRENVEAFAEDPDAALLLAIEKYDPDTGKAEQVAIDFQKHKPITHTDDPRDALVVSLAETGRVDWSAIRRLTGLTEEQAQERLVGAVYNDPNVGWVPADEYLSGNVRRKLEQAREAAEADTAFEQNVKALEAVQPEDIPPSLIAARLGAAWMPGEDVADFMRELLDERYTPINVRFLPEAGKWVISTEGRATYKGLNKAEEKRNLDSLKRSLEATTTWGTPQVNFIDLMDYALNGGFPTVYTPPDSEGKKYVDKKATAAANAALEKVKAKFASWVWEDPERADRLSRLYNDSQNNVRLRRYKYPVVSDQVLQDGRIRLPGMSLEQALRPHQADGAWRVVQGNAMLAHEVGTGKTWTMAAAAMEGRRLGLFRKPMITVLNSTIGQFKAEFLRLYPGANILAMDVSENKIQRKKQLARISLNDWDAVLVTHESFSRIPMSAEAIRAAFQEELQALENAILEAKADQHSQRVVKELEKSKRALENKMMIDLQKREKDDLLPFEELGVDVVMVDEAQKFKNLMFATRMGREIRGLQPEGSGRAFDLYMKTKWLNGEGRGRVVLATGTPISNSVGELYTISRYLQPEELKARGIQMFDPWANSFGDIGQVAEYLPEGGGYKMVTKFNRFVNIPELMQMVYTNMDVVKADQVGIKRPKIKGGAPVPVVVPQNPMVEAQMRELAKRAKFIRESPKAAQERGENMLVVVSDGRKGAMDMRLVDSQNDDHPDTKTNHAVRKIAQIWKREAKRRGTQLVFADLGTPGGKKEFSVYEDLKAKLIEEGIPAGEIAFVHDAKNDRERAAQFAKVRAGTIRVWVASTEKGGTGVNVQERVAAIHNLDVHWNLANYLQRLGRGQRQGNLYEEIEVFNYATEGTVDAFMWDKTQAKGRFVDQIMSGDVSVRTAEDISQDTMSAAEMVAVASGDPLIQEKVELEADVGKLRLQAAAHQDTQRRIRFQLAQLPKDIENDKRLAREYADISKKLDAVDAITIEGKRYRFESKSERQEAAKRLIAIAEQQEKAAAPELERIGKLRGMERLKAERGFDGETIVGKTGSHEVGIRVGPDGARAFLATPIGSMDWAPSRDPKTVMADLSEKAGKQAENAKASAKKGEEDLAKFKAQAGQKFDKADELAQKEARLTEVEKILIEREKEPAEADAAEEDVKAKFRYVKGRDGTKLVAKFRDIKLKGLNDHEFFVHEVERGIWNVSHAGSGWRLTGGESEQAAVDRAKTLAKESGDKVREAIENAPVLTDAEKQAAYAEASTAKLGAVARFGRKQVEAVDRDELADLLERLVRKINPDPELAVEFANELRMTSRIAAMHGGKVDTLLGSYSPAQHLIRLSLAVTNRKERIEYAAHEAWHSIERLLTPAERQVLLDAYPSIPGGKVHVERVAIAFSEWGTDPSTIKPPVGVRRIFGKALIFLRRLGNALRRRGFQTAEDVFARAASGQVGARYPEGPPAGTTTVDQDTGAPRSRFAGREEAFGAVAFENPETEARWQDARRGVGGSRTMLSMTRDWLTYLGHGFTRHWINLPNSPQYADAQQQLRKLEAAPQAAKERVVRYLSDLVGQMDRAELDLFTRKVVLDDLSWEVGQGHDLPFGLTPETVRSELARVDAALTPELRAAVRSRKAIVASVANELARAGVLREEQIRNPAYYRHQVLDYARLMGAAARGQLSVEQLTEQQRRDPTFAGAQALRGAGKKIRTPRWAKRMGSARDINANLLEAEFDWMYKALTDIATARTIEWIKRSDLNVRRDVIEEAKRRNRTAIARLIDGNEELAEVWKGFRQSISIGLSKVRKELDDIGDVPANLRSAVELLTDPDAAVEDETSIFPLLAWILDNDKPGAMGAAMAFKAIGRRRAWVKAQLGRDYYDPTNVGDLVRRGLAPAGYVDWQPDEGRILFTAKTIPEHVMDRMLDRVASEDAGPVPAAELRGALESVRTMMAVGGPKYQMVIPLELAETLNSFGDPQADGLFELAFAEPLRWWKRWVLINPRRVLKYNINNLSGDLDAIIAGSPKALRRMPQAIRELYAVARGREPTARYREAVERGVFDSGLTVQEIPDINTLAPFEHLIDQPGATQPIRFAMSPLIKVWRGLQGFTRFRENWLRYAAYLDYVERLEAGEDMRSIGHGASNPKMVNAVTDTRDRAALLARDLVGDYGAISTFGAGLRRKAIPFWSWCTSADTEILTSHGWRRYDQIKVGDNVLTYSVERHETEWQPIKDIGVFDFDGDLMTLENGWGHKYRWTKDHRVPVIESYNGKRKIVRAHDLKSHHSIPVVAPHRREPQKSPLTVDEAAMLGWIVTDGYFRWRGNHFEAMIYQAPKNYAEHIRERFAGAITSEYAHPDTGVICFRLAADATRRIAAVFRSKDDLPGIVTRLDRPALEALYDAMLKGDGRDSGGKGVSFNQVNGPVLDAFQIACYLLGKAAHIRQRGELNGCFGRQHSGVYVKTKDRISLKKWTRGEERYTGKVWCPVTDNSTWVMRQNGCVLITGNSEINTKRYWRLTVNTFGEGVGSGLKAAGIIGAGLGIRTTAYLTLRMALLYGLVQLWNNLVFPDEEEELSDEERARLHLTLGRSADGQIRLLRFQGAFSDALSWMGFTDAVAALSEVEKGRASYADVLAAIAKAPVNKIATGLTPLVTAPIEFASGLKLWPDAFRPRQNREPWRNLAQLFSLEHEYDLIFDRPSRGYGKSLTQSVVYERDIGENAYNQIRELAYDWLRRERGLEGAGGFTTPRAEALRDFRTARRYGDQAAETAARARMRELGMGVEDIRATLKRAHPLGPVPIKYRGQFLSTLDERELRQLRRAQTWYNDVMLGGN